MCEKSFTYEVEEPHALLSEFWGVRVEKGDW